MNSCNTDLEQVKLVAHALLNVEIQPTEFSSILRKDIYDSSGTNQQVT